MTSSDEENDELSVGDEAVFTIRPENIVVHESMEPGCVKGRVVTTTYKGNQTRVDVGNVFDNGIHISSYDYGGPGAGEEIYFSLPESKVIIYKK